MMKSFFLTDTERLQVVCQLFPIMLLEWDTDGTITHACGRGLKQINLDPECVCGRSVFELMEDIPNVAEYIHSALAGKMIVAIVLFRDRVFETYYYPFVKEPYRNVCVLNVVLDVTGYTLFGEHSLQCKPAYPSERISVVYHKQIPESVCPRMKPVLNRISKKLTLHQIKVLRYAASGMKTSEIAQVLNVAPSTIKWHFKQIYCKLDVHNRTAAVSRARDLNLLD